MGSAVCGRRRHPIAATEPTEQRPKVAFVSPCFMLGGVERWLMDVARFADLDYTGICLSPGAQVHPLALREMRRFMPIHCADTSGPGAGSPLLTRHASWKAAFAAIVANADILVLWGITGEVSQIEPSILPPVVVSVSHGEADWTRRMLAQCRPLCTHFAAVAEAARAMYSPDLQPSVKVIHNGADPGRCVPRVSREETRQRYGIPQDAKVVGYIGRYAVDKDPGAVIRAVSALPKEYFAVLQGSGELEPALRASCLKLIPGRFAFLPYSSDVGTALAAMDCVIVASQHEGFCYVIAESWLARVPVVSTRVGIVPHAEQQFGQLTWPIDFNEPALSLRTAVMNAVSDPKEICERAYAAAWNNYTAQKMGAEWREYLTSLVTRRRT